MNTILESISSSPPREAAPGSLPRLRVLCVDDNVDAAESLGELLRLSGANVVVRHDGPAALEAAEWFAPDVCFLDVAMPAMDGCDLARRLRYLSGNRPLLLAAVTARDGYDAHKREADAGFDLHFTKPADPADLTEILTEFAADAGRVW